MSVDQAAGVIHDIGYQRYTGPRLGRGYAFRSLYAHGLRTAYGLGRSGKAKIFPWAVAGIVLTVAVVVTAIRAQTGESVLSEDPADAYVVFTDNLGLLAILFTAIVGPELVSRDLRSGVLPLYFSRALRTGDYALAKLAALVSAVWLLFAVPQLVIFLGGAFSTDNGVPGAWDEFTYLVPGLLHDGGYAVVFSCLALAIASFTGKRAFAAGGIVAVFLMTGPISGVLGSMSSDTAQQLAGVANPAGLVVGLGVWAFGSPAFDVGGFGPVYGLAALALVAGCTALLLARYRRVAR